MAARTPASKKAVAPEPAAEPTGPRPWRLEGWGVETRKGTQFGWRIVANDGTTIAEVGGFDDPLEALRAGQQDERAVGAVIQLPPRK